MNQTTAPKQPIALMFLTLVLVAGVLVIGALVINTAASTVQPTPTYRPTNTPDFGSDAGIISVNPPQVLSDFTMTRDNGEETALSVLRGRYTLVYFGYTNCPDACPITMVQFTQIKRALGDRADQVQFAMISLDPERDTPERLRAYLDQFDPSFIGLIAQDDVLDQVANEYGLTIERGVTTHDHSTDSTAEATEAVITALDGGVLVNHTTYSYVIDPEGNLRSILSLDTSTDAYMRELERIMAN